ncbi:MULTISPECIES: M13 family metallopeptidase [unclassified Undibacterium]|uniref:M13 family metallopeptidase n=1 Tax=unclassified Undibacterium TaxID=2630295 RepID=UPI002AC8DE0C|nr:MULTISPECIES: M13 family metallopeptidase [unclassified Undibacterium]MEB0139328.1 M13 family metallopeptidase [Undibacterium sp. CCC2.1]MEB0172172.1 M13 family metallopeptidase [Undibacterium sp. CCC1.1]MEB0176037.1 M13 family metallopeptidase [Undibacterium sp. CCC3.4]WPX43424.1 M13 family metallopeptidase [Undibacterium sp. CCC3.4]
MVSLKFFKRTAMAVLVACACVPAAAQTMPSNQFVLEAQTMDLTADPCRQFFEYANGNWLKNNPIPADRSRYSAYDEVAERNLTALKRIAEAAGDGSVGSPSQRLVGAFYVSGMNEARIEQLGFTPLAAQFAEIAALSNQRELMAMLARLHKQGVYALFGFDVGQDAKNATRTIPELTQGGLGLPDRDYYLNTDAKTQRIRAQYLAYITHMFMLVGESETEAQQAAAQVVKLETQLAKASLSKVALRDPQASYHLSDMAGLQKLHKNTPWQVYFNDIGLPQPGQINLAHPQFLRVAAGLVERLSLPEWKTYLRWELLNARAVDLSHDFVDAHFDFYGKTLAGTEQLQPRWKRVLGNIDAQAGEALGQLYVAEFFPPDAKAGVLEMVNNIKAAMRASIGKLAWMSEPTKQQAYKKLDTVMVKIGYPDVWRDYSSLQITPDSYVDNVTQAAMFEFQRGLAKLGKPIDRNEWGMTPQTVNAYYNPSMNEIVFPAGILQPPLYHPKADAAANYGNTGATIGHELTHAFDDEGRQFDAEGNLKSWWSKRDEQQFLLRVKAIEQQFDEFNPIDTLHVNGKLTAGENIADLGGMKIALQALRTALEVQPQAALIDGLTPEQRFFVANGQSFRSSIRAEMLRLRLLTDPHAPDKYRVIAPLANLPEFSAAFSCQGERSPLRHGSKLVQIW